MKVLIVAKNDKVKNLLAYHLKPIGFEITHYNEPVKAINNLEELNPEMILFHAGDFPRQWKPLLKLVRESKTKEETVFILLKPEDFVFEEAAKATHLGINGIINSDISDKKQIRQLEELFRRYRPLKDKRRFHRLIPGPQDRLQLLITHPFNMSIITGSISEISIQGASFKPTDPSEIKNLKRGQELSLCSLRVGDDVISLMCKVTRNRLGEIGLQIRSFETGGHHKLFHYIQNHAERELKTALSKKS